jgi:integrase
MRRSFHSRWARELKQFIDFRQTYFKSAYPKYLLLGFDNCASAHPRLSLPQVLDLWLHREPQLRPNTRLVSLRAVRLFCLYRRRFDPQGFVPELLEPTPAASQFKACILSTEQIKLLIKNIDRLRGPPLRLVRLRTLFLVLYCTGLRLGEALRLRLVDVDLKRAVFRIGPSKNRIRLVPFGRDLAREIQHLLRRRRQAGFVLTPQTPLFEREDGRADNVWNAWMRFSTLFRHCGLKPKRGSGRDGLRVHDLRHNFAVHRLQRWYRAGLDPGPLMPWLSAYMGHINLLGTQRYLQATSQTLAIASRRLRRTLDLEPVAP